MGDSKKEQKNHLDLSPEQALFGPFSEKGESKIDGIVAALHTNERPLQGLAGLLDWHFHGAISDYLRAGAMSGESGEIAYLPLKLPKSRDARTYHVLLIGAGASKNAGTRQPFDDAVLSQLKKNIQSLKLKHIAVSRTDFGAASNEALAKQFKEVPVWIVR